MTFPKQLWDGLFGSIVVALSAPSGIGPVTGGWIAARRTTRVVTGGLAATVAGIVGALPWTYLVYLAAAGKIAPVGYHDGVVHVGINPAAPETFVLWQELTLSVLVGVCILSGALIGGCIGGLGAFDCRELRGAISESGNH